LFPVLKKAGGTRKQDFSYIGNYINLVADTFKLVNGFPDFIGWLVHRRWLCLFLWTTRYL